MALVFPIVAALPELKEALRSHRAAVLQAPPGAGKSTVVPLALLDEPWTRGRKLLVLEPRRLAARAVAVWRSRGWTSSAEYLLRTEMLSGDTRET